MAPAKWLRRKKNQKNFFHLVPVAISRPVGRMRRGANGQKVFLLLFVHKKKILACLQNLSTQKNQHYPNPARIGETADMSRRAFQITPELMLRAYSIGLFPMAEARDSSRIYWLDPEQRGILPLDGFHLPRRLLRTLLSGPYTVTADADFPGVIAGCAEQRPGREQTWINGEIEGLFTELARAGHAHSIETWQDGRLVGGLYGVSLGAAFYGESMFSRARDASKVALAHLVARMRLGGYRLLDTQFVTSHLAQFGAVEIPRARYKLMLEGAVARPARWLAAPDPAALVAELRGMAGGAGEAAG
jgi:leucyl/phenylalanyl-tRNA--protein transferase